VRRPFGGDAMSGIRVAVMLAAVAAAAEGALAAAPEPGLRPARMSVYLGTMEVDDQSVRIEDSDVLDDADIDFSTLPGGGIFVEMPLAVGPFEAGVETGGGVAWRNEDTDVYGSSINGNTTIRVDVDNSFFLADLEMGVYARLHLGDSVSLYAGGGPALVYGSHEVEDETVEPLPADATIVLRDDESADFAVGYYGRAGIDFAWTGGYRFGLGAKWLGAELDFDETIGTADIDGVFYFLSFSQVLF
jgi:Outer membrane protein beta-barrel domain